MTLLHEEYFGIVKDIEDPGIGVSKKKMRRIRVTIPELGMKDDEYTPWAFAVMPFLTDWLPTIGDVVMMRFKNGNPATPYYIGLVVTAEDVSDEFLGKYGNDFRFDADINGNKIRWSKNGIEIEDAGGNMLTLHCDKNDAQAGYVEIVDANENVFRIDKEGVSMTDISGNAITTSADGISMECKNGNKIEMISGKVIINDNLEVLQ